MVEFAGESDRVNDVGITFIKLAEGGNSALKAA